MLLTKDDIVTRGSTPVSTVLDCLNSWVDENIDATELDQYCRVRSYGNNPIERRLVRTGTSPRFASIHGAEHTARWIISSFKHADYIVTNPHVFLPIINSTKEYVDVKHSGVASRWYIRDIQNIVAISSAPIIKLLEPIAKPLPNSAWGSNSLAFQLLDERLSNDFLGDPDKSTLQRAWYSAKRDLLNSVYLQNAMYEAHLNVFRVGRANLEPETVTITAWSDAVKFLAQFDVRPDIVHVRRQRNELMRLQRDRQGSDYRIRQELSNKTFTLYWDNMKSRLRSAVPSDTVLHEQFATIPLQPEGTESSRTWGIEVETVRAQLTSRPAGWESVYDGSLNDSGGSCDCDCDTCCDGDHCDDSEYECYYNTEGESREFVSPVLSHFNSNGLRQLCSDLPDDEDDTSPGIHVHIGARDLSVTDVARLLAAYSIVQPLLAPLYHRQTTGYCNEMASDNIKWWLGAARRHLATSGTVPSPVDLCEQQPATRYQDVNVHALAKHGTIEFRAMGPYYNYDHLIRWAWFCREMVNVSKLGIPQAEWTKCRSLLDVINLLRKYGEEMPTDKQFQTINSDDLVLAHSEE